MPVIFLSVLAMHLSSLGADGSVFPQVSSSVGGVEKAIVVGESDLWREADRVSLKQTMYCGKFVAEFSADISSDGVEVRTIRLNKVKLNSEVRVQAQQSIKEMGGFDYAYLICSGDNARLAFDWRDKEGKVNKRFVELNARSKRRAAN